MRLLSITHSPFLAHSLNIIFPTIHNQRFFFFFWHLCAPWLGRPAVKSQCSLPCGNPQLSRSLSALRRAARGSKTCFCGISSLYWLLAPTVSVHCNQPRYDTQLCPLFPCLGKGPLLSYSFVSNTSRWSHALGGEGAHIRQAERTPREALHTLLLNSSSLLITRGISLSPWAHSPPAHSHCSSSSSLLFPLLTCSYSSVPVSNLSHSPKPACWLRPFTTEGGSLPDLLLRRQLLCEILTLFPCYPWVTSSWTDASHIPEPYQDRGKGQGYLPHT